MRFPASTRRRLTALTAAAALAATTLATGATTSASPTKRVGPNDQVPNVAWAPCFQDVAADFAEFIPPEFGPPTYECSVVPVPLDHDRPNGPKIQISLVRLPALDPAQRIGSMFINPGGPGGSGVEFAVFGAPFLYSPDLRSHFDIVGFDPRGIARSTALKCFGNLDQAFSIFQAPIVAFPKTLAEAQIWASEDQRLADACAQRGNKVLGHMSTANVARDLDLLRAAVGDDQLTYAGYSYGSYLGVTYANLFPDNVRALIVDGVLDPVEWSTGSPGKEDLPFSARLGSEIGAQATLDEFFRLCEEAGPAKCAFAPNAADRYEALAAALLADEPVLLPIEVEPGVVIEIPIFYGDLIGMTLGAMYDSFSWSFVAEELAFLEAVVGGGFAAAPPGFSVGGDGQLGYTSKRGFPRYMNFLEGFPAVACADSNNPDHIADWFDAAGEISSENYFRQLWTFASSPCLSFPAADDDRYMGPFTAETDTPLLVASTLYDPATPVHGAFAVKDLMPESGLLLVDGWGHTTLGISGCASFFSEQYLKTQVLPPEGLVCPQDFNPFDLFGPGGPGGEGTEYEQAVRDARHRFFGESAST
ncbi:MAG: alpha/beta fold hydrolase [Ilumatobacter sp.]|nr:alpha/beta fold hydrolase [Ilumatobacter sp.]